MEAVSKNSLRLSKDPSLLQKRQNVLSLETTFLSEWRSKKGSTVSLVSECNVFRDPKHVLHHYVLKTLERSGLRQVVTNGQSPSRNGIFILSNTDYHGHVHAAISAHLHPFPASTVLSTGSLDRESAGLARDHPARVFKASFAIRTAKAEFLFVSLMFKVAFLLFKVALRFH